MALERVVSTAEVLDRVLDKGIVIDGWVIVSLVGLDLIGVEGRAVVASLTTYSRRSRTVAKVLGRTPPRARAASARPAVAAAPPRGPAALGPAVPAPALRACPRCRKRGRRQPLVQVTVQTDTETRVSLRCSVCEWQRTSAA